MLILPQESVASTQMGDETSHGALGDSGLWRTTFFDFVGCTQISGKETRNQQCPLFPPPPFSPGFEEEEKNEPTRRSALYESKK